jgi:hypothetical protein
MIPKVLIKLTLLKTSIGNPALPNDNPTIRCSFLGLASILYLRKFHKSYILNDRKSMLMESVMIKPWTSNYFSKYVMK